MKKWSPKKIILILIIPVLILSDILVCTALYFFEPISYNSPDLSISDYSFDLYKKYSDTSSDFYIKQISADDIIYAENDIRLKYIKDTILIVYNTDLATLDDIAKLISPYNGKICGYIRQIGFVQAEFPDSDYSALTNICSELAKQNYIYSTLVDYFEETPTSEAVTITQVSESDLYYNDIINYPVDLSEYNIDTSSVSIGIFDILVDSNNINLNVKNKADYDSETLNNVLIQNYNSHGTHVAGICAGAKNSGAPSVCPSAQIISDNATNCSVSYWVAAITDMIVRQDVKVINMSIGYNSYITLSATLGCSNTLDYISKEAEFFGAVLNDILNDGFEFVICTSAGNASHSTVNRIYNGYFSYGEKELLNKLDFFNIYSEKVNYANSLYTLPFTWDFYSDLKDVVIVTGSCDMNCNMSYYTSLSDRIDIVAPGENIYSYSTNNNYEYMSGTSMASPFVAGTAALLFAENSDLTGEAVKNIIVSSATETITAGEFTFPVLNVTSALEMIK